MIAAPLTRSKTDHYTGALAASRNESALQPVSAESPIRAGFSAITTRTRGMTMGKSWFRVMGFGLLALVAVAAAGCGQIGMLKAKMAFKDANQLYQNQDYRAAAAKYEEVLANDPNLTYAYFFLGNSYDQQYRSVKRGDAANDAMLTKAIENYKKSAEVESDPKIKRLALDYLVSAYGPDKLNDPAQAEPILLNMSITQDVFKTLSSSRHTGQIRLDLFNFGNLLNSNWGAGTRLINTQILTSPSADANGALTYNLQTLNGALLANTRQTSAGLGLFGLSGQNDIWSMMLSFRYTFN